MARFIHSTLRSNNSSSAWGARAPDAKTLPYLVSGTACRLLASQQRHRGPCITVHSRAPAQSSHVVTSICRHTPSAISACTVLYCVVLYQHTKTRPSLGHSRRAQSPRRQQALHGNPQCGGGHPRLSNHTGPDAHLTLHRHPRQHSPSARLVDLEWHYHLEHLRVRRTEHQGQAL